MYPYENQLWVAAPHRTPSITPPISKSSTDWFKSTWIVSATDGQQPWLGCSVLHERTHRAPSGSMCLQSPSPPPRLIFTLTSKESKRLKPYDVSVGHHVLLDQLHRMTVGVYMGITNKAYEGANTSVHCSSKCLFFWLLEEFHYRKSREMGPFQDSACGC